MKVPAFIVMQRSIEDATVRTIIGYPSKDAAGKVAEFLERTAERLDASNKSRYEYYVEEVALNLGDATTEPPECFAKFMRAAAPPVVEEAQS